MLINFYTREITFDYFQFYIKENIQKEKQNVSHFFTKIIQNYLLKQLD